MLPDRHQVGGYRIGAPLPKIKLFMKPDDPHPILLSAHSAVLLIFFVPSESDHSPQQAVSSALAKSVQAQLGNLVRVLRIGEADHPDVVQSFAITQLPAFVLIRRGVELWRQQGPMEETTLVEGIRRLLPVDSVNSQPPA